MAFLSQEKEDSDKTRVLESKQAFQESKQASRTKNQVSIMTKLDATTTLFYL